MMMEKGTFKNLNNRFQPPPQICPDGAGKPIGFRNSITAFLVLSSMYYVKYLQLGIKFEIILLLIISVGLIIALFCFILETVYKFIKRKTSK